MTFLSFREIRVIYSEKTSKRNKNQTQKRTEGANWRERKRKNFQGDTAS